MIQAFSGSNTLLIQSTVADVVAECKERYGDMAVEKFDAAESSSEQILGAVEAVPFLTDHKLVVVRDLSVATDALEVLEKLCQQTPEGVTDVIIVEGLPDKRSAYYKKLKQLPKYSELNDMDESGAARWVAEYVKEQGGDISSSDARYLVERMGSQQLKLNRELQKLLLYSPKITRKTIELLTDEQPTATIFNLIDAAFSGHLGRALDMYSQQRMQKVEPQAIQAMLVWQMHAVALAAVVPKGMDSRTAASQSGLSPYVLQKSQRIAQHMSLTTIRDNLKLLRDIDAQSKRQAIDLDEALQYAIVHFSQSTSK